MLKGHGLGLPLKGVYKESAAADVVLIDPSAMTTPQEKVCHIEKKSLSADLPGHTPSLPHLSDRMSATALAGESR